MIRRLVLSMFTASLCVGVAATADVIGRMTPAESLAPARVATLPAADRAAWTSYLERSQKRMADDKAALAAERAGLRAIPDSPPQGRRPIPLDRDASWYGSADARRIADNIVSFQTPAGGWGKNQDRTAPPRVPGQHYTIVERLPANARSGIPGDDEWAYVGTIDNGATITELRFLAKVQQAVPGADGELYRAAAVKGVRYLLDAQYPNGGWPQVYPLAGGYHDAVTFNDDAFANVAELLAAVAARQGEFSFVTEAVATSARDAVDRALALLVTTHVVVDGHRTGWGQQHDPLTLKPVGARNYEPASLSSHETAALLAFLMRLPAPSPAIVAAVHDGVAWLAARGLRDSEWPQGPPPAEGRRVMSKIGAGPTWARFYDLTTMRPIFGDRDQTIHDDVNEISVERRNGYSWYGAGPASTVRQYEAWATTHPALRRQPAPAASAPTQKPPVFVAAPPEPEGLLSREIVELWPVGRVPGAAGVTATRRVQERGTADAHDRAVTGVSRPMLEVFRPAKPNGAAMVILPGGGYMRLAIDKEGAGGAHRMTQVGITAFVLDYRLPVDRWGAGYDAALQDVQRAVRLVRANAATWGLDPHRIGVMGFSAGGHLAAASLTRYDAHVYEPVDVADQQSARPDVVMLGYSFNVVGPRPIDTIPVSAETGRALHERVRAGLAPTFLVHAADDRTVPVANSLDMFRALKAADVPAELHIYQEGGHGFGFSLPADHPASRWPDAFEAWLRRVKFM